MKLAFALVFLLAACHHARSSAPPRQPHEVEEPALEDADAGLPPGHPPIGPGVTAQPGDVQL